MRLPKPSRLQLLPAIFAVALLNPFTYFVLHLTRTYSWVIPFSVVVWLAFDWERLKIHPDLQGRPTTLDILGGALIITVTVGRCLIQDPSSRMFGAFDSLGIFIGICLILFGYRSLRALWVPAAFLLILGSGYKIEQFLVDRSGYDKWLAASVARLARPFVPGIGSDGNRILLPRSDPSFLLVDYGCTGLKAILAFAFIAFVAIASTKGDNLSKAVCTSVTAVGFWVWSVVRLVVVCVAVQKWGWPAVRYHTTIGFGFFLGWLIVVVYLVSSPRPTRSPSPPGDT